MYQFNKGEELLAICRTQDVHIPEVMLQAELEESDLSKQQVLDRITSHFAVMEQSIQKGLDPNIKSIGGLIGGNAYRLEQHSLQGGLSGKIVLKAAAYALAVTEVNAAMGKIVAAPTAGASGVVPGVVVALMQEKGLSPESGVEALLVAAAIGKIIATNATLSGAEGGCQAEVGSAAAMAAAAAAYLSGADPQACLDAAAMALKSLLGLVCDPVAGLVEVPCSKRNATGAANALMCADMALSGITSYIPFDEVVEAMYRVGRVMSPDLRETALGGCAVTPTALDFAEKTLGKKP